MCAVAFLLLNGSVPEGKCEHQQGCARLRLGFPAEFHFPVWVTLVGDCGACPRLVGRSSKHPGNPGCIRHRHLAFGFSLTSYGCLWVSCRHKCWCVEHCLTSCCFHGQTFLRMSSSGLCALSTMPASSLRSPGTIAT